MPRVLLVSRTGSAEVVRMDKAHKIGRKQFRLYETVGDVCIYERVEASLDDDDPFPVKLRCAPHVLCFGEAVALAHRDGVSDLVAVNDLATTSAPLLVLPSQPKPLRVPSKRSAALVARAVQALMKRRGGGGVPVALDDEAPPTAAAPEDEVDAEAEAEDEDEAEEDEAEDDADEDDAEEADDADADEDVEAVTAADDDEDGGPGQDEDEDEPLDEEE
jgi:hypothetical protein